MLKPIFVPRTSISDNKLAIYLRKEQQIFNVQNATKRYLILKESEASLNRFLSQIRQPFISPPVIVQQLELVLPFLSSNVKLKRLWNKSFQISETILSQTKSVQRIALKPIQVEDQPWLNHLVQNHHFLHKPVFQVINPNPKQPKTKLISIRFGVWKNISFIKPKHHLLIGQLKKPLNFFIQNTKINQE